MSRATYADEIPTILLIRHAQGSFGAADYDVLSNLGREQSAAVGRELAGRGLDVSEIQSGALRRQRDTADPVAASLEREVIVDPRWNEYEMDEILASHSNSGVRASRGAASEAPVTSAEFQGLLEQALSSWITAGAASPAAESWPGFTARVRAALEDLTAKLPSGSTALVFTSGGVIAAVCAALFELPAQTLITFNRVMVNTGITKLVVGRRGTTLVSFNEHTHLERGAGSLVTYR